LIFTSELINHRWDIQADNPRIGGKINPWSQVITAGWLTPRFVAEEANQAAKTKKSSQAEQQPGADL